METEKDYAGQGAMLGSPIRPTITDELNKQAQGEPPKPA